MRPSLSWCASQIAALMKGGGVTIPKVAWAKGDAEGQLLCAVTSAEVGRRSTSATLRGGLPPAIEVTEITCRVEASADDYDVIGETTNDSRNVLAVRYAFAADPPLELIRLGYAEIDTSAIPDLATVLSATLHWYTEAADAQPDMMHWRRIIHVGGAHLWSSADIELPDPGAESAALGAAALTQINKTGKTIVQFSLQEVGSDLAYEWDIRSFDYDVEEPDPVNHAPYLVVKYAMPKE